MRTPKLTYQRPENGEQVTDWAIRFYQRHGFARVSNEDIAPCYAPTGTSGDAFSTPLARISVLKRDGTRFRACGRRPDDHVDVELHDHHIRPWSQGVATEPFNLVTL